MTEKRTTSSARLGAAALIAASSLLLANLATFAGQRDWVLYNDFCPAEAKVALEVGCGDYGVFYFGIKPGAPSCAPKATGSDDTRSFPLPPATTDFFTTVQRLEPVGPLPLNMSTTPAWVAAVDFHSAHGVSVTWLAGSLAGPNYASLLLELDNAGWVPRLGSSPGDRHLVANLCLIAEIVDHAAVPAPSIVNMSFGRAVRPDDLAGNPSSNFVDPTNCPTNRTSCQVAKVIAHLAERGSEFIAAGGNTGQLLFPAATVGVAAVGGLDTQRLLNTNTAVRSWESASQTQMLMPGSGLCLDSIWSAPAGSSYSAAVMSGWAALAKSQGVVTPLTQGSWAPHYSAELDCWRLAVNGVPVGSCNESIRKFFQRLASPTTNGCWWTPPSSFSAPVGAPQTALGAPSYIEWHAATPNLNPTPGPDPCVPCIGSDRPPASGTVHDLGVNMGQATALAADIFVDAVRLRVGTNYYPVPLTAAQLASIKAATLGDLVVPGAWSLVSGQSQPSLVFTLRSGANTSCSATPGACFWVSTPLRLIP